MKSGTIETIFAVGLLWFLAAPEMINVAFGSAEPVMLDALDSPPSTMKSCDTYFGKMTYGDFVVFRRVGDSRNDSVSFQGSRTQIDSRVTKPSVDEANGIKIFHVTAEEYDKAKACLPPKIATPTQ